MYPYIYLIIPSYGLLSLIGGIVAICYDYFNSDKEGVSFIDLLSAILYSVLGLLVGSKLLFAITQIPWLIQNFSIKNLLLLIPQSGYVFYGGLFGIIFALCIMCKESTEYKNKLFRLVVPVFPLFHVFGRIGCFLAGCCYGKTLHDPLVILDVVIYKIPIQLIEVIVELLSFVFICVIKKKAQEICCLYI